MQAAPRQCARKQGACSLLAPPPRPPSGSRNRGWLVCSLSSPEARLAHVLGQALVHATLACSTSSAARSVALRVGKHGTRAHHPPRLLLEAVSSASGGTSRTMVGPPFTPFLPPTHLAPLPCRTQPPPRSRRPTAAAATECPAPAAPSAAAPSCGTARCGAEGGGRVCVLVGVLVRQKATAGLWRPLIAGEAAGPPPFGCPPPFKAPALLRSRPLPSSLQCTRT